MHSAKSGKTPSTKLRAAGGRPPAHRAGEVDARILAAASTLFLASGFEGASCEQVAALAGCGKASIYARYADKSALFEAMIRSAVERSLDHVEEPSPNLPLTERLVRVCTQVVEQSLTVEAVQFMRLLVSEAARFPLLVAQADRVGRDRAIGLVAAALASGKRDRRALGRATVAATSLIEIAYAPLQLRALVGDPLPALRARAGAHVALAVAMLSRADAFDLEA